MTFAHAIGNLIAFNSFFLIYITFLWKGIEIIKIKYASAICVIMIIMSTFSIGSLPGNPNPPKDYSLWFSRYFVLITGGIIFWSHFSGRRVINGTVVIAMALLSISIMTFRGFEG